MPPAPLTAPGDDLLARYAVGAESPGVSLLLAAHLSLSPASRARLALFEALAGALLEETDPAPLDCATPPVLPRTAPVQAARVPVAGPLPRPVAQAVGVDFDAIPWRRRLPGVAEHDLADFAPERVSLLRARPGAWLPRHSHRGRELTLVLTGTLQDGAQCYRPGDIASNAEHDDHKPQIIGDTVCHCLIVLDGGLRYTGTFTRALNLLGN